MKKWTYRILGAMAIAYPAVLLFATLLMYYVGEKWWASDLALYLPRALWAAPLPFLVVGLLALRAWPLLLTQALAGVLALFPLMGLVLPWPTFGGSDRARLRVLSYNVNSGWGGVDKIIEEVERFSPDVAFLQETNQSTDRLAEALRHNYAEVRTSTQFVVASRFPIVAFDEPERLPFNGAERSPRFVRQVLETPLGQVAFFHVHPISPRLGFYRLRGAGVKREILSGRFFTGERADWMQGTAELRELQMRAVAESAGRAHEPVVVVGDTNLPGLSAIYRRHLSSYKDGFREAGSGFGYTFPTNRMPWLRLDRILASDPLKFVRFEVGQSTASDHHCVVADLVRD